MTDDLRSRLQAFEQHLDAALDALPVMRWASTPTLRIASEIYEVAATRDGYPDNVGFLDYGYTVLARYLTAGSPGYEPQITDADDLRNLHDSLVFAAHYYMARDYLYYSYNVPGSLEWSFDKDRVEIKFADRTIPRQFFTVHNDMVLNSMNQFKHFDRHDEIVGLLKDEPEGEFTPNVEKADKILDIEVDLKLGAYFSLIPPDSQIDLGGYSYAQMLSVYRMLLKKALYHRYLAKVQDAVGAIYMPEVDLIKGIEGELGIPAEVARGILKDLVFDPAAVSDRADAAYFSMMREGGPDGRIVMRPHHFTIAEGLVDILRVIAQRRPQTYLQHISNEIGHAFVRRVRSAWEAEGFICASDLSLRDFDPSLPDIDLLVISVEPTLGYVIFVCELKSPIPPRWAKDQLRVLNKDGVSKAFKQVKSVQQFMRTEAGIKFLASIIPKGGHPNFDRFLVVVDHLIITSDNAGMFFGQQDTKIINFRTLERLLRRSDGDMALIQNVLATYNEHADQATKTKMVEFHIGSLSVSYEAVTDSPLMEFPQGEWRSLPERQEMIDQFIAEGFHPFDVLEDRQPDAIVHTGGGDASMDE